MRPPNNLVTCCLYIGGPAFPVSCLERFSLTTPAVTLLAPITGIGKLLWVREQSALVGVRKKNAKCLLLNSHAPVHNTALGCCCCKIDISGLILKKQPRLHGL